MIERLSNVEELGTRYVVLVSSKLCRLTHLTLNKISIIAHTPFSNTFSWMKNFVFCLNFTICSKGSNWQKINVGSGNGLAPNRWQAITWTNTDLIPGRIYAALGGNGLIETLQLLWVPHIHDIPLTNNHKFNFALFWFTWNNSSWSPRAKTFAQSFQGCSTSIEAIIWWSRTEWLLIKKGVFNHKIKNRVHHLSHSTYKLVHTPHVWQ